jgi:hypothetical protein
MNFLTLKNWLIIGTSDIYCKKIISAIFSKKESGIFLDSCCTGN